MRFSDAIRLGFVHERGCANERALQSAGQWQDSDLFWPDGKEWTPASYTNAFYVWPWTGKRRTNPPCFCCSPDGSTVVAIVAHLWDRHRDAEEDPWSLDHIADWVRSEEEKAIKAGLDVEQVGVVAPPIPTTQTIPALDQLTEVINNV